MIRRLKDLAEHARLLSTSVGYLTPKQLAYRLSNMAKRRVRQVVGTKAPYGVDVSLSDCSPLYFVSSLKAPPPAPPECVAAFDDLKASSFTFLNHKVVFDGSLGWHDPTLSQLWRYHLHYFDYVTVLLLAGESGKRNSAFEVFKQISESWLKSNGRTIGDGWHPYTLSLRLVNWAHASAYFEAELDENQAFRRRLMGSLYGQAQFLERNLEFDVRGNHLLKNIRALLWAGIIFEDAAQWLTRATNLLRFELEEQVLSDGGHFERSPGYHAIVLKDVLEMAVFLDRNGGCPSWLNDSVRRMCEFLLIIVQPDNRLPLLKDTAWDASPNTQDLLAAAAVYLDEPKFKRVDDYPLYCQMLFGQEGRVQFNQWPATVPSVKSTALTGSDYFIFRDDERGDSLIFDVGRPCPDYLPAHAHADLLSFELQLGSRRVIVDSGVFEYQTGRWRDYFRSTRAHNTLEVGGKNQSEVWASFRVADRARVIERSFREEGDVVVFQGAHDGYRKLGAVHRRTIYCVKDTFWLIVDELLGDQNIECENNLHFHPDVDLRPVTDNQWAVELDTTKAWVFMFGHERHVVIRGQKEPRLQGWYSEEFGLLSENSVVSGLGRPSQFCGYCISKQGPVDSVEYDNKARQIVVCFEGEERRLDHRGGD